MRWIHFPLHPDTPDSGLTLEELFLKSSTEIEIMEQRLSSLMAEEGLPYGNRTHTYNSRLAQELAMYAETFDEREALNRKLFEAYFVEGLNFADPEVLLDLAESSGLPRKETEEIIRKRLFRNDVDEAWKRARELGVRGVPTFIFGNRALVGVQPYETLKQLVQIK